MPTSTPRRLRTRIFSVRLEPEASHALETICNEFGKTPNQIVASVINETLPELLVMLRAKELLTNAGSNT